MASSLKDQGSNDEKEEQTFLQKIDLFGPEVDSQEKEQKKYTTVRGGLLSILTVALFTVLMSIKIVDHLSIEVPTFHQMKRKLAALQSDPNTNVQAYNYYSETNFKFYNTEQTIIDPGKFYKPLNLKTYFVDELNIVLNNEYNYDTE